MHCIQTLILTMDTAVALNQLSTMDKRAVVEVHRGFQQKGSSTLFGGGEGVQVMCTGEGKRNSLILLTSSLPQSDTTQGQERPSWLRISPTGQRFRDRVNM